MASTLSEFEKLSSHSPSRCAVSLQYNRNRSRPNHQKATSEVSYFFDFQPLDLVCNIGTRCPAARRCSVVLSTFRNETASANIPDANKLLPPTRIGCCVLSAVP